MRRERDFASESLDEGDVELLRFMHRTYNCRTTGADCPARADCPEGFYVCDAIANIVGPGSRPDLGNTARVVLRYLYEQIDCADATGCPARDRCHEGEREPCETLLLKLGVATA